MKFFITAALVLFFTFPAAAQDPAKVDAQHHKVIYEDTGIRVVRLTCGPQDRNDKVSYGLHGFNGLKSA